MQVMQEHLLAHPSGRPVDVQIRIVQGCTGAVKHKDVRKRPPDEFVELGV